MEENKSLAKIVEKLNAKYDTDYYNYLLSDCAELLPKNKVRHIPNYRLYFSGEREFDNLYVVNMEDFAHYKNNDKEFEECDFIKLSQYLSIGDVEDIVVDILTEAM